MPAHDDEVALPLPAQTAQPKFTAAARAPKPVQALPSIPAQPAKSALSASLAALRRTTSTSGEVKPEVSRSTTFAIRPKAPKPRPARPASAGPSRHSSEELEVDQPGPQRDSDDLTILENLDPGPKEHGTDPEGGEEWLHLEPNSHIRLL